MLVKDFKHRHDAVVPAHNCTVTALLGSCDMTEGTILCLINQNEHTHLHHITAGLRD